MVGDTALSTETELKLEIDAAAMRRLRRHAALKELKRAQPRTRFQKSVYFDTPDFDLRDNEVVLRVRHIGRRRIQTLKTMGECLGGAWARREWETEISGDLPEAGHLQTTDLAQMFADGQILRSLRPLFTTEIKRTIYLLGNDEWEVELALDEGQVTTDDRSQPIIEAELELKAGLPHHLFDLALTLQKNLPARVLTISKGERGYALVEGKLPQAVKAARIDLTEHNTVADALQIIARSCIQHLLANQDCLTKTGAPEAVHQMRVAIRRLRSAFNIFKDCLNSPDSQALWEELRWLQGILSPARDIHVFIDEILTPFAANLQQDHHQSIPGLAALQDDFERLRDQAYQDTIAAQTDPRLTRLILTLGQWVEGGQWLSPVPSEAQARLAQPVGDFARQVLRQRDRKVAKALKGLDHLPADIRHQGRIEVKKLRYAVDFFAALFSEKKARKAALILGQVQDDLGMLNDIAVAEQRLSDHARASQSPDQLWAAGMIAGWHRARLAPLLEETGQALKRYDALPRFWKE